MADAVPPRSHDPSLVRRMRSGDLDAFEAFFERYRTPIYRTAYGLTGDRHAAEEVLQDTFARAWQRRDVLDPKVSPLPWLHRVALNLSYSRLRRRHLPQEPMRDEIAASLEDPAARPHEHAERRELQRIVRESVAALSSKQQAVVMLHYVEGMSLQETAEALGVAIWTVKSRLHSALRALRDELERDRRFRGAHADLLVEPIDAGATGEP